MDQTQPMDQGAVNLAKAIRQTESDGDFNAKGKSGESGAYQWTPDTWKSQAQNVLGDSNAQMTPANQNAVAYGTIKQWKDNGLNAAQIAAKWNSGSEIGWENKIGTNNYGAKYNVPQYVKSVTDAYQKIKNGGQVNADPNNPSSVASTANTNSVQQPDNQTDPNAPKTFAGKALNFLFPIGRDIVNDIKGTNTKTGLQQFGDLGLSALPFIPGLGEAGEAARGAEAGIEGGVDLAKSSGLLDKAIASPITKGAVTGYGAGVASNLSQGQNVGQAIQPNLNTLGGAVLGGAAPLALKGLGGFASKVSGIDPQIENELRTMGTESNPEDSKLYDKYINATKSHATNLRAPAPLNIAADELDKAAEKVSSAREEAGQAVGNTKNSIGHKPFGEVTPILDNFDKEIQSKFGVYLAPDAEGNLTTKTIPGGARDITPEVQSRIVKVANQLNSLKNGTLRQASDIASNISDLVDYSKKDLYGNSNDPLEGLLKNTDGSIRQTINETSPEMAQANANFSGLKNLETEISSMAGKNLNRGELLMKRVFSGDKSGDIQDLFDKIKQVTGIDLTKHAVLAKHAIDSVGSSADKTLLEKAIEGGVEAHTGGTISAAIGLAKGAARSTFANPETIGRDLVNSKPSKTLTKGLITKGAIELGSRSKAK